MAASPDLPPNRTPRFLSIGAAALALSGVTAYWLAADAQCRLTSLPPTFESCPLSSIPVWGFLAMLTAAALVLAAFSVYPRPGWPGSVASAVLVAGAFEFPVNHIFTALVIPPGVVDPVSIATAFVLSAGLAGFVASAWLRRHGVTGHRPYNRLAFASALIALTALAIFWFPGTYPGAVYGPGCPVVGLACMSLGQPPIIPEAEAAILIALALGISIPMFARKLTSLSAVFAAATLAAVAFWWGGFTPYPSIAIAIFTITVGAVVALSVSVPRLWSTYVVPRFTRPTPSAQR
jgi:hypothetical protein